MPIPMSPIRVGLVGAGPWAEKAYAPLLAAGPETRLAGVWARRREAAEELAARHGCPAVASFEDLLACCEAVAFAVPPDVQVALAIRAAEAGRHLLLDKPLALTLEDAHRLTRAVEAAGVVSQLMLTQRFRPSVTAFLETARAFGAYGARLDFLSGAFLRGPYATPWRQEHGALHDLGPHAFDLLEGAFGPIGRLTTSGDPRRWIGLTCAHESGVISTVALTGVLDLPRSVFRIEVFGPAGALVFDLAAAAAEEPWTAARRSFAEAVRSGQSPEFDVHRGLALQKLIDQALVARA